MYHCDFICSSYIIYDKFKLQSVYLFPILRRKRVLKKIKILSIIVFAAIIAVPIAKFNFTPNTVSLIDNRKLAENPFEQDGDITVNIENYVNDRIGFRDKMISTYTLLNDKLFGKMVHPSYTYGKDGYVFGAGITTGNDFSDFHIVFADMVQQIQLYCEERNVPFLFVFNPAKPAVYEEYIADGIHYDREWVQLFFAELEKRNVNYLDNTVTMKELAEDGLEVFNKKYDANHWNDLGAFYGTQKVLEVLKEQYPSVHVNELSEFIVSKAHKDSLMVSEFPIDEDVPLIELKSQCINLTNEYSDIKLHPSYKAFGYCVNEQRQEEQSPKALVFQGSYMNSYGAKYFMNAFGEYIYVHDYQNVIEFPYYYEMFQPDCVIFEVAEYTFANIYFDYEMMKTVDFTNIE